MFILLWEVAALNPKYRIHILGKKWSDFQMSTNSIYVILMELSLWSYKWHMPTNVDVIGGLHILCYYC